MNAVLACLSTLTFISPMTDNKPDDRDRRAIVQAVAGCKKINGQCPSLILRTPMADGSRNYRVVCAAVPGEK